MNINKKAFLHVLAVPPLVAGVENVNEELREALGQDEQQRGAVAMRRGLVWLLREAMISESLTNADKLMVARTLGNGEWQRQPKRAVVQLDQLSTDWAIRNGAVSEIFALASDACSVAVPALELIDDEMQGVA